MPDTAHRHLRVWTDDGSRGRRYRADYRSRRCVRPEPGHDAWTVGEETCILFDTGVVAYAKPAS